MTQDNQKSQPPFPPESETNRSELTVQPAWKSVIIRILRGTIGLLEATVEKLETQPKGADARRRVSLQWWSVVLGKIRSLLPENLSTKLSDTALTGILAGFTVILVWTTSTVFSSKPTEIAIQPTEESPPATITTPPEIETLPPSPSAEETPPPVEEITPPPSAETPPPVVAEETPPPTQETPPPVVVEETPPVVAQETPPPPPVEETPPPEPEPEPTPTPTVILTPEQTLIAAIENQVAEISDRFASGLIQSIQANFRTSSLAVTISEEWYNIKPSQQEKLLSQMLQRSKELDFSHLDIVDSQGRLVARNPVVGTEMIVFQRRTTT